MKTRKLLSGVYSAIAVMSMPLTCFPQDTATAPPPPAATAPVPAPPPQPELVDKIKIANISSSVQEIVKMSEAGTDPAVLQSYVESSNLAYVPRPDEIIYMHDHGIPGMVITTMIQHGAKLRDQVAQAAPVPQAAPPQAAQQPAPTYVAQQPAPVYVDTPSYVYSSPNVVYVGGGYGGYYGGGYYGGGYYPGYYRGYYGRGYYGRSYYSRPYASLSFSVPGFGIGFAGHSHSTVHMGGHAGTHFSGGHVSGGHWSGGSGHHH